jgi:integrase
MAAKTAGQIKGRGKNKWLVRVDLGRDAAGKRVRHNKTVHGSKKDAQKILTELLRAKDTGTLTEQSRMSLNAYLDHWLATAVKPQVRERTYLDYKGIAKRYIRGPLGNRLLTQLTPVEIQKLYSTLLGREVAPRTVRYCHTVLNNALEQAVKWCMLTHNPALHVDLPRKKRREMQAMTETEAQRFLAAATCEENHALFVLLLTTGLRPSEALGLKWGDFDPRSRTLSVARVVVRPEGGGWAFEAPKTSKSRRSFEVPNGLATLLLEHRTKPRENPYGLIFPNLAGAPCIFRTSRGWSISAS